MNEKKKELEWKKKSIQLKIRAFMEETDIEESRKLSNQIKELANDIVNLRKEIKGTKELRREFKRKKK